MCVFDCGINYVCCEKYTITILITHTHSWTSFLSSHHITLSCVVVVICTLKRHFWVAIIFYFCCGLFCRNGRVWSRQKKARAGREETTKTERAPGKARSQKRRGAEAGSQTGGLGATLETWSNVYSCWIILFSLMGQGNIMRENPNDVYAIQTSAQIDQLGPSLGPSG